MHKNKHKKIGMKDYVGIYRVLPKLDINGDFTENKDDTYIPCLAKCEIYRYDDETLAYYCPSGGRLNNLIKIIGEYIINPRTHYDGEDVLLFKEENLDKVIDIFGPTISGKNTNPFSIKNIPKEKRKNEYEPKNPEKIAIIKQKLKELYIKNGKNLSIYGKFYGFIEQKLSIPDGKTLTSYCKINKISQLNAIDSWGQLDVLLENIDNFIDFKAF